jgi:hypothetical protein
MDIFFSNISSVLELGTCLYVCKEWRTLFIAAFEGKNAPVVYLAAALSKSGNDTAIYVSMLYKQLSNLVGVEVPESTLFKGLLSIIPNNLGINDYKPGPAHITRMLNCSIAFENKFGNLSHIIEYVYGNMRNPGFYWDVHIVERVFCKNKVSCETAGDFVVNHITQILLIINILQ